ncbi:MAG TPA: CHASE3 domain-containing protein [Candidatus Sulfotelmatobacter sp.]|nr:CHASE3 domain-containing protein [Candidatus Sulfotelmatobacter sp.]
MKTIIRTAVPVVTAVLLVFMAVNAYLAVSTLLRMQKIGALTVESAVIQSRMSNVLRDLTDMETGQRGYLLTGDSSYLQPYTDAKARIEADFAELRMGLAQRTDRERYLESQVEQLAASKQAEMERSITLRQDGYRHRAFRLVNTNEGMEYMDKARGLLASLSLAESNNFKSLDRERNAGLSKALTQTIAANACLLLMTGCLFGLIRRRGHMLEREAAQSRQELCLRDLQLSKLMSILSNQARSKTSAIEANARLLLQNYGGFLPKQGHECAEQIQEASVQMERLRRDLVGSSSSANEENEAVELVA